MLIGVDALFFRAGNGRGIERHLRGLLSGLSKIAPEHRFVLFTNPGNHGTFETPPEFSEIPAPASPENRALKVAWGQLALPGLAVKAGVDVLLCPGNTVPALSTCPTVAVVHDCAPLARPEGFRFSDRLAWRVLFPATVKRASRILCPSRATAGELVRRFGANPDKIRVTPCGVDPERFHPDPGARRMVRKSLGLDRPFVFCAAGPLPHKNIRVLLAGFALLKKKHGLPHLLVVTGLGAKQPEELDRLARSLSVSRRLVLLDWVADPLLAGLYAAAEAFVFPSLYEGFGLPVLEAMACGAPVCASRAPAVAEAAGNAALFFEAEDPRSLAETLASLLKSPGAARKLSEKGLERARSFSWERTAGTTLAALKEAAGRPA